MINATARKVICAYCGMTFDRQVDGTEHWLAVHKEEHDAFKRRRMERFGY